MENMREKCYTRHSYPPHYREPQNVYMPEPIPILAEHPEVSPMVLSVC